MPTLATRVPHRSHEGREHRRLLVIIPDQLTQIIDKGELQPCYYNPGNLFDEVHILMTNADRPPLEPLRFLVGDAELHVHNHPDDLTLPQQPWRQWFHRPLRNWAAPGVELARRIRPQLIRCHGADWNVYLAHRIKRALRVPYLVSLHINPDVNPPRRILRPQLTDAERKHNAFYEHIERIGLRHADLVMPVYESILPYLRRLAVTRVEVCYNVLNPRLREKASYAAHRPFRIISVGRLIPEKNPAHLLRAVARMDDVHLTVVGDGPERPRLEALSNELGAASKVAFRPAVLNDDLCAMLPEFDLFAVHTEYWELNKSVLEALLTGLPVVINRRRGEPVPELAAADIVHFVDDTAESYAAAVARLKDDDAARESLGRRAFRHARTLWAPEVTEAKVVRLYRRHALAAA